MFSHSHARRLPIPSCPLSRPPHAYPLAPRHAHPLAPLMPPSTPRHAHSLAPLMPTLSPLVMPAIAPVIPAVCPHCHSRRFLAGIQEKGNDARTPARPHHQHVADGEKTLDSHFRGNDNREAGMTQGETRA